VYKKEFESLRQEALPLEGTGGLWLGQHFHKQSQYTTDSVLTECKETGTQQQNKTNHYNKIRDMATNKFKTITKSTRLSMVAPNKLQPTQQ